MTGSRPPLPSLPPALDFCSKHHADSFLRTEAVREYLRTPLTFGVATLSSLKGKSPSFQVKLSLCTTREAFRNSFSPHPPPSFLSPPLTSWNHSLMIPACIWILLISLCTWGCLVMYISSNPSLAAASMHTDKYALRHTCILFPQRNHSRVQTSHVLFQSVSQPVLSCSFHQGSVEMYVLAQKPTVAPQNQQWPD